MSCYVVSNETIQAIVWAASEMDCNLFLYRSNGEKQACRALGIDRSVVDHISRFSPTTFGQFLLAFNIAQVNERYGDDEPLDAALSFEYRPSREYTLGEAYGCLRCYDYQCCDSADYRPESCGISVLVDRLKAEVTQKLFEEVGMDVPWGLEDPDVGERQAQQDAPAYDLASESRDMEVASDELGRNENGEPDGRDGR